MKIVRVEWFKVDQFVHEDKVHSPDLRHEEERWDVVPKFIVQLHADSGLVGLGETPRGLEREQVERASRTLVGAEPLKLNLKELPFRSLGGSIYRGFEAAVFDLVGKARGMRVCELLGGAFREQVQSSYWASRQSPDYSRSTARAAREGGFTCLKIKAKKGDPLVERVRAMHEEAPDLRIIIDPMQRYDDVEEMIGISRQLEPYNVLCLEDPLPKKDLDAYRRLRREGPIPLALHVGTPAQVLEALRAECVDILNCSPGSMVHFVQMAELAELAGIPCWHGSGADLGILDLSYVHACAAARNCTIPSDILSELLHVDDFVVEMPERRGEWVQVPRGPGLGVELDMGAVEQYLIEKGEVR